MRIGTMITFETESFENKVAELKKYGFDSFQLQSWNPADWTDENAEMIKSVLTKYDAIISAFWCGWEGPAIWDFYDGLWMYSPYTRKAKCYTSSHL